MNIKRKKNKRVIEGKNLISFFLLLSFPGERSTAGNGRCVTENTRKLEGVFRSGISLIFSGGFQQLPVLSGRIFPEIIGKNPGNSRPEYCFHVPGISRVFLQDPVTFPHLSWKILRDPVAETIDLGCILNENKSIRKKNSLNSSNTNQGHFRPCSRKII